VLNDNPGRIESLAKTLQGLVNGPPVYFDPLGADCVPHVLSVVKLYQSVGVEDPMIGFYSNTDTRQGLNADQRLGDSVSDIAGRRPSGDLPQLVSEWRSIGSDLVRKEYKDAIAIAGAA
jgi:hypothetical protein